MDTLKQLQEKGDAEFDIKFPFAIIDWKLGEENDGDGTVINKITEIKSFLHQQTTLAFEAGKAETIAMVLKEIEKSYHGYGSGDGYLIDRGFNIALDTLKTKLQAKE